MLLIPDKDGILAKAFLMGLRFDNVIASYISLLPLVILSVLLFVKKVPKSFIQFIIVFIYVAYILAFFLCASNIPYFEEFDKNINASVFHWLDDSKFVIGMIIHEPRYFIYFFLFLLISFLFIIIFRKITKTYLRLASENVINPSNISRSLLFAFSATILIGSCILGIRGRTTKKSPIRVGTAYFSNYAFLNKLSLNPVFVFMRSTLDMNNENNVELKLIDNSKAFDIVLNTLHVSDTLKYNSPIARNCVAKGKPLRANVVVVLMEGMSAHFMYRFGYPEHITPFLDSLSYNSLFFDNFYSDGIHTMNGLYATLWGFHSLLRRHPLDQVEIPKYMGLPNTLKEKGYNTIYFSTHDDQFDNIGGFFKSNGFQKIVSQKDYPSEKVISALGVPDDYMFNFSFPDLDKLHKTGKPFLAVYLTASNHGPIVVPEYFKSHFTKAKEQIIEYSDWAIQDFLEKASQQTWFNNTIFVFSCRSWE